MGKPSLCAKPSLGKMNKLFTVAGLFAVFLGAVHAGVITAVVPSAISAAPILNATTITACGVRVNWNVPSSNGGKPILHYTIYATGLKRTTAYTFTVTSTNEIGESAKSPASASVTSQNFRKYIFVSDFLND